MYNNPIDYSRYKASQPSLRRSSDRSDHTKRVHAVFYFLGFIAALGGAIYSYDRTESIALPIFVFLMVQYWVGRGLGDVATDPEKVKRFVYFTLLPVFSFAILWLTYQWWELMWLSAILGFLLGLVVWSIVAMLLFPRIHGEELEDAKDRQQTGGL